MPWQDVHLKIDGLAAWDIYHNFVQKWNNIYEPLNHTMVHRKINSLNRNKLKAYYYSKLTDETDPYNPKACDAYGNCKRDKKTGKIIQTIKRTQRDRDQLVKKYESRENKLRVFLREHDYIALGDNNDYGKELMDIRHDGAPLGDPAHPERHIRQKIKKPLDKALFNSVKGTKKIQIVRSICSNLGSDKTETSIHEVFCRAIQSAKHYVYIESQYLQSPFGSHIGTNHVLNLLVKKILDVWIINEGIKYQNKINKTNKKEKVFRAYLVYPIHPEGTLDDPTTLEYMYWQFQSTHRTAIKSKEDDNVLQADGKKSTRAKDGTSRNGGGLNIEKLGGMIGALEEKMGKMYHITYIPRDKKARRGFPDSYDRVKLTKGPGYKDITKYFKLFSLRGHGEILGKAVTEQIYVHSKMMIVDDRVAIIGSANISDRSFTGDGDAEIAAVILDTEKEFHHINGKRAEVRKFARDLRIKLWEQHLGSSSKGKVDDPLSESTHNLICNTARDNTKYFDEAFPGIPSNKYPTFYEQKDAAQKVTKDINAEKIKGHLVNYPLFWGWSESTIKNYWTRRDLWMVKKDKKRKKTTKLT